MHELIHLIKHPVVESLKLLPFLFLAYLLMEGLEHHASEKMEHSLQRVGRFGPIVGAVLGCIPQCGFSAAASNLYAAGIISQGTLMAVFLSTSDEAIPLLLANPGSGGAVWKLILWKIGIALFFGFLLDFILRLTHFKKAPIDLCKDCGCDEAPNIWQPALHHTLHIFVFVLIINLAIHVAFEMLGEDRIAAFLLSGSALQPFIAALLGLIPNCAVSVMLTQLYLSGALSFGSVIAGLCSGAGLGVAVLLRTNTSKKENIQIVLTLYAIAALTGCVIQILGL